jgi:hypothetical protein
VVLRAAVHYADGRVIVTGQPGTTALAADGWVAVGGSGVVWTPPVDVFSTGPDGRRHRRSRTGVDSSTPRSKGRRRIAPYGGRVRILSVPATL